MALSIVVSGPPAIGKTTVAKELAGEFGLCPVSGGDVLKEMAAEQGFDSGGPDWWDTDEGMRFLGRRAQNPEFDRRLDQRLMEMFRGGGVVITSYTLPWLIGMGGSSSNGSSDSSTANAKTETGSGSSTTGNDGSITGIRLWLDGSAQSSAQRMGLRDNMPAEAAFEVTRERLERNRSLYRELYGFDFGYDESVFELAVETDGLTARQVADLAKDSVRRFMCRS